MGLTIDPDELWRLSRGWEEARDDALKGAAEIEDQILTRWYSRSALAGAKGHQPRNRGFGYMALILPHLVQSSPRWKRRSDGTMLAEWIAEGTAAALTSLHREQQLHRVLRPCAWDFGIAYSGAYVDFTDEHSSRSRKITKKMRGNLRAPLGIAGASTPTPSMFERPGLPTIKPLDRRRWGWDTLARTWPEVRAYFHDATYDIAELEYLAATDDSWDQGIIDKLIYATDWESLGYAGDPQIHGQEVELRRQVVLRQFWLPDAVLPQQAPSDGDHGVIVTVVQFGDARGSAAQHIRKPRYYRGHHSGPYAVGGQYQPSKSTFPMTRLLAAKDSTDMVNALAVASGRRMMQQRRVNLVDGAVISEARKARNAPDGSIVGVTNMFNNGKPLMVPVDFGGLGTQDVQMMQWAIADNDESLAMLAAQRGATGQSNNATEVAVASQSYETALGYVVSGWDQFLADCGVKAGHHLYHNRRFFTHLDREGKERLRELQVNDLVREGTVMQEEAREIVENLRAESVVWQGGDAEDAGDEFDPLALSVELEAGSTGVAEDARVRGEDAQFNQELFQLAQMQGATPWMDLTPRFRALGEAYGKPGVERMIDKVKREEMLQAATIEQPTPQFAGFGAPTPPAGSGRPIVRENAGTPSTRQPGLVNAGNAAQTQGPQAVQPSPMQPA